MNADDPIALGYRRARELTRQHAKSFHFASHALPPDRRQAALALYAFCRRLDDLVDEPGLGWRPDELRARLERARELVRALFAGDRPETVPSPFDPAEVAALGDSVARWGIPEAPFQELISGVEMDLTVRRYATFAELDRYCFRVAGTVGLLMAPVLVVVCADPAGYVARYAEPDKAATGLGAGAGAWAVPYWFVDAGMAAENLLLAVVDEGLGACFFGVFDHEPALRSALGIPGHVRTVGTIAIGRPDPEQARPSRSSARGRRDVGDVLHRGRW